MTRTERSQITRGAPLLLFLASCRAIGIAPATPPEPAPVSSPADLVGRGAPPFSIDAVSGKTRLTVPTKRVTVLAFVAAGSGPCLASFEKLHGQYPNADVFAVAIDPTKDDAAALATDAKVTFPLGWDQGGNQVARRYAAAARPGQTPVNTVFVLDRGGIIRFGHAGTTDGCAPVDGEVAGLLGQN